MQYNPSVIKFTLLSVQKYSSDVDSLLQMRGLGSVLGVRKGSTKQEKMLDVVLGLNAKILFSLNFCDCQLLFFVKCCIVKTAGPCSIFLKRVYQKGAYQKGEELQVYCMK